MGVVQVYSEMEKNSLARLSKVVKTVQVSEHSKNVAFQLWREYWKEKKILISPYTVYLIHLKAETGEQGNRLNQKLDLINF